MNLVGAGKDEVVFAIVPIPSTQLLVGGLSRTSLRPHPIPPNQWILRGGVLMREGTIRVQLVLPVMEEEEESQEGRREGN